MKKLFFLFSILCLVFSCSQRLEPEEGGEDVVTIYKRSIGDKSPYFSCSVFADQTFRGTIWKDPKSSKQNCIFLNIDKAPNDFLKKEELFLQIYPFHVKSDEFIYGSSLTIKTFEKRSEEEKQKILMESKIIDTFLIEAELELESDYFFLDHFFELCDLDSKSKGLQLVIYERRENHEKSIPLRTTKALLPPFLIHPKHFRESKGELLAAYHPFESMKLDVKSNPKAYYDFAEELCADIL